MKKFVGLLFMMLMILVLTACGNTQAGEQPDLDGFHFIYNDAGEYIWLGMTLEEVESIDLGESDVFTIADTSDADHPRYGRLVLGNRWFALVFDDNERVAEISMLWTEGPWFVRGDITPGSALSEVEEVFNMSHVHIGTLWSFYFTYDHLSVYRESEDAYYSITFFTDDTDREYQEQVTGFIIEKIEH